jgi:hypothetical protein
MSVFVYSLSLLFIGGIIAVSFHLEVGLAMMLLAMLGIFSSMLHLAHAGEFSPDDEELDRQIQDTLRHTSR